MRKLIVNRIKTPDGTIIESRSVHDFKTHRDKNGEVYAVDGGLDYTKRCWKGPMFTEMSVYSDDPHEIIREAFSWGSYGKNGDQKLHHILLCEMTDEHIEAVISKRATTSQHILDIMMEELRYREQHDLHVSEGS